jgi:hypothetical protein
MKRFVFCIVLLLVSIPISAGILGISAGATGGVERWKLNIERAETQTFAAVGLTATLSPPFIPVGIRGGVEYAWKTVEDVTISDIFILLGLEYSVAPPLFPASFYLGTGLEMATFATSKNGVREGSSTDFGVLFYGGINFCMGLTAIFVESGYGIIFAEELNYSHIPIRGGIKVSL